MNDKKELSSVLAEIVERYDTDFRQLKLLPMGKFLSHLGSRGLSFTKDDLEKFKDIVTPISFSEELGQSLYHPYQAWLVHRLKICISPSLHWSNWLTEEASQLTKWLANERMAATRAVTNLRAKALEFYELLKVLVAADPYCIPDIRGKLTLSFDGSDDQYMRYLEWRASFDASAVLNQTSLSVAQLTGWHQTISVDAGIVNQAESWYLLMRYAKFDKRDKLKGKLRLAFDFYEIAESLRIVLEKAGNNVLAEDDYLSSGGGWKMGFYGVEKIDFTNRIILKRITREFGLDGSYKGYWYIEGPTEEGFIQEYSRSVGINLERFSIALSNIGGTGDITARRTEMATRLRGTRSFSEELTNHRANEVFVFITADDDQGVLDGLESLRTQGLLTAGFIIWNGDFEKDNFKLPEIKEVIKQSIRIEITDEEIQGEINKKGKSGKPRALGETLQVLVRKKPGGEQFGKSADWGKALAKYALENPKLNNELRPIIKAFQRALRLSNADFRLTIDKFECNNIGDIVPKK